MRIRFALPAVAGLILALSSAGLAATISGTVKDPGGAPFEGAFVQAQNTKTKITVMALSDSQGRYTIDDLDAGDYRVQIRAVGYRAAPRTGLSLTASQAVAHDIALQTDTVRWRDITINQARVLLPEDKGKEILFESCFVCHGFQTRMAAVTRDLDGWRDRIQYMRDAMRFNMARVNDADAEVLAQYLNRTLGEGSELPKSPTDMPAYKSTVRKLTSDAMNIVYVEYDLPGPNRMPFSAMPDGKGNIWIPNFGSANKLSKLDPKTGAIEEYTVPNVGTAAIHAAVPAPDGSVWVTEQGPNKLGRWDPATKKVTEYQAAYLPGKEGLIRGGSKHTVRFDPAGNAWSTGDPLARFDRESGKYTDFSEAVPTYSLHPDKDGNIWYTMHLADKIGKVDWKTLKNQQWDLPTKHSYPRRLDIDKDGNVWIGSFDAGKLARFNPKTEKFTEYDLPGPAATPYGLVIAPDGYIWYSSYRNDVIGRFDPKTGKVTEYPFPHTENTIRELFMDPDGKRVWYGTPSNNKVGYFYLKNGTSSAQR